MATTGRGNLEVTEVEREVALAYTPWLKQKKEEVLEYFNSADTPAHYKDYVVHLFKQLDRDGSGAVQLEELVAWARDRHGSKLETVPPEYIAAQFHRVDLDGSGELDFEECLLLQYLGCLNMTWCSNCSNFIDVSNEDGYTCASCFGKFGKGKDNRQHDLCVKCYDAGAANKHIDDAGDNHAFIHMSQIKSPDTVTCSCCMKEHSMVRGYMQGNRGDRHVRPVGDDPSTWVCELCALQSCKCGSTLRWRQDNFKEGSLFHDLGPDCVGGCAKTTTTVRGRFTMAAATRIAPHCLACKEMMMDGTMPWPAEPELPKEAAPLVAPMVSATMALGSINLTPQPLCKQAVCVCCQDVHDLTSALDGKDVMGYLYAPGFPEHMKLLPNGQYLCEWCSKYICGKCGTHYTELVNPKLAIWSKFVRCDHPCEPMKWGGWGAVRSQLRTKADDMTRPHCRACRLKIVTGTLMDLSGGVSADGRLVRQVVCYCCKETHEASELGSNSGVPAYLAMPDYGEHVKELPDGRFLCEWCTKWMCHKCGTPKWTDTRPEVGLWSERSYYCRAGCIMKDGGNQTWDLTRVRATAHDLDRIHCRLCRERIIMGKLAERPHRPPARATAENHPTPAFAMDPVRPVMPVKKAAPHVSSVDALKDKCTVQ